MRYLHTLDPDELKELEGEFWGNQEQENEEDTTE